MKQTIRINELPTRTWNRLGVNAAEIEWDDAATFPVQAVTVGAGEHPAPLRLDVTDAGACTERAVDLRVAEGGDVTIFVICRAEHPLALRADITLAAGAHAKVVLLENPSHGATIGDLDAATLFYFESRGIDRAAAQAILSRAAIERLIRMADDEAFAAAATAALDAVLGEKGGKDA